MHPLYFILVRVTVPEKAEKAIAVAIVVPIVVVAIVIIAVVLYYRFRKNRHEGGNTSSFSENQPGLDKEHYSGIPAQHHTYENPSSQRKSPGHEVYKSSEGCLQNPNYQLLHANTRPERTYAALTTESKV